jgi:hypothetical protein
MKEPKSNTKLSKSQFTTLSTFPRKEKLLITTLLNIKLSIFPKFTTIRLLNIFLKKELLRELNIKLLKDKLSTNPPKPFNNLNQSTLLKLSNNQPPLSDNNPPLNMPSPLSNMFPELFLNHGNKELGLRLLGNNKDGNNQDGNNNKDGPLFNNPNNNNNKSKLKKKTESVSDPKSPHQIIFITTKKTKIKNNK